MTDHSKPIRKDDDASKQLIIELLDGAPTFGFDIDSIYYLPAKEAWVVFEFLKTDHRHVRPRDSHPRRYWRKNWRKFASLWRLVTDLSASGSKAFLCLVNYEDIDHARSQGREDREFHIIWVLDMDPTEEGGVTRQETKTFPTFAAFQTWFQAFNRQAGRV
ncbi:MAG TPA: hypothetical protein ENK30_03160 [Anaerolineae bacterium]|nr:hypothetical protein [Anaerolineae bacterium]